MKSLPPIGAHATVELVIKREHLASQLPVYQNLTPALPAVCATAVMITLLEKASAMLLTPYLEDGETSVGIAVDVSHDAATPEGGTLRAEAVLTEISGIKLVFEVTAHDDVGIVGKGTHKRAVINKNKLEAAANERNSATA